jgi:pilus assembly protein Flp/PilA
MNRLKALIAEEKGATAIEYGLIVALIALACIMAFMSLGMELTNIFDRIRTAMAG